MSKGISEINAKSPNRSIYLFTLEVLEKPSTNKNAKIGKANLPRPRHNKYKFQ
jgi:hypothetical protein